MLRSITLMIALLVALAAPTHAFAVGDEPDVINDPPAAFDDAGAAAVDLDDLPAEAETAPAPEAQATIPARDTTAPAFSSTTPRGELPFTGPNGDIIAAVLLGTLLVAGGSVLRAIPTRGQPSSDI